ncbi:MAG: thiopeptide-type bacteriocin biosynthesis protein, partial [Leadbetterella sp.]|nr:thiopeptide-type bacteriocin biosynthesis protein [Leadbetterella sp.]
DSANPLLRRVFLDSVKGKSSIILKEFLADGTIPVRNAAGQPMVNQLIAFLIRKETVYDHPVEKKPVNPVQRTFSLGSEWVYLKFYCGTKSADFILEEGIAPVVRKTERNGWVDQWFFIRYHDPENHLRVRFHLADTRFLPELLRLTEHHIRPFERNGLVWKVQADTYRRELERYGNEVIKAVEKLFWIDSRMYLDFLRQTGGDEREDLKWLWGLRNIDGFLAAAGLDIAGKKALMEQVRSHFAEEFNMDQGLKSQIDRRYRARRKKMEEFLNGHESVRLPSGEIPLSDLWKEIRDTVEEPVVFERILTSCIHMTVNRLVSSGQRLHELLMYDFLCRYYTSKTATSGVWGMKRAKAPGR